MACAGGEASLSLRLDDDVPYTGFSIKCSQSYERMPTQTQGSFRFWDTDDQARAADVRCTRALWQSEFEIQGDAVMRPTERWSCLLYMRYLNGVHDMGLPWSV